MNWLKKFDLLKHADLADQGRACGYHSRKSIQARGEYEWMHILFKPIIEEPVREIVFFNENSASDDMHASGKSYFLPEGLGDFFTITNGGFFFAGHVQIFSLDADPTSTSPRYEATPIKTPNELARSHLLMPSDLQIGYYFYQKRMLLVDEQNQIVLTKPNSRKSELMWRSFAEYLDQEFPRYDGCFDQDGMAISQEDTLFL